MKKLFTIAAAIAFVGTLSSCKKDYTCTCKYDDETYTYEMNDVKKSDAKDACNAIGNQWILLGGTCDFN